MHMCVYVLYIMCIYFLTVSIGGQLFLMLSIVNCILDV